MWVAGQQVYNDQNPDYVDKVCFNQEFKCTESIPFQIREADTTKNYSLRIKNAKTGAILQTLPYVKTLLEGAETSLEQLQFQNPNFDVNMDHWNNWEETESTTWPQIADFSWEALSIRANDSKPHAAIYQRRDGMWPAGDYTVVIGGTDLSTGPASGYQRKVHVVTSQTNFLPTADLEEVAVSDDFWMKNGLPKQVSVSFTLTEPTECIGFSFNKEGSTVGVDIDFYVSSIEFTVVPDISSAGAVHDLDVTPSTYGLCDSKVIFEVIDEDDVVVAYSDKVLLSTAPRANILIRYKSLKPFASLYYTAESDYNSFRFEGRFFKERPVTQQDVLELSNNIVINTGSEMRKQRELVVGYMPDFMHNKIILALQHAISGSVKINNGIDEFEWTIENDYELVESQSEKYSEQAARIWLTRKNYYLTNVL